MPELDNDLPADLALAVGRLAGTLAMAPEATRAAAAGRRLQVIWDTYLRDAGAGEAGPEHGVLDASLLASDDPRRDGVLLWLASHGAPPIAAAAQLAVEAVGAERRLPAGDLELLAVAVDRIPPAQDAPTMADIHSWIWSYVEALRQDSRFAEGQGEAYLLDLPGHRYQGWRSAEPSGCWAANLALASLSSIAGIPMPAGLLSRELFRLDLEAQDREDALCAAWLAGGRRDHAALFEVHHDLARGEAALTNLSRNARARDAWAMLVSLHPLTRRQFMQMLELSRSGAWLVAGQLVKAGLAATDRHGRICMSCDSSMPAQIDSNIPSAAAAQVDEALADLDRLLARGGRLSG